MWCSGFFYVRGTRRLLLRTVRCRFGTVFAPVPTVFLLKRIVFPAFQTVPASRHVFFTKKTRSGDFILLRVLFFFFWQKFRGAFKLFQEFA